MTKVSEIAQRGERQLRLLRLSVKRGDECDPDRNLRKFSPPMPIVLQSCGTRVLSRLQTKRAPFGMIRMGLVANHDFCSRAILSSDVRNCGYSCRRYCHFLRSACTCNWYNCRSQKSAQRHIRPQSDLLHLHRSFLPVRTPGRSGQRFVLSFHSSQFSNREDFWGL